jgi:hypothetical protein
VIIHASRTYLTGLPGRIAVCPACRNSDIRAYSTRQEFA